MKDFFDVWHLSQTCAFEGRVLAEAVRATFAARSSDLPAGAVVALTDEFVEEPGKRAQWNAFMNQAAVVEQPPDFSQVVKQLREFLLPLLAFLRGQMPSPGQWNAKTGWS